MNPFKESISKLEQGWCTISLREVAFGVPDRFCALGALGASLLGLPENNPESTKEWEDAVYKQVATSEAAIILAQTIYENHPEIYNGDIKPEDIEPAIYGQKMLEESDRDIIAWTIYKFNDRQDSSGPILEMFREAARRWDAKYPENVEEPVDTREPVLV